MIDTYITITLMALSGIVFLFSVSFARIDWIIVPFSRRWFLFHITLAVVSLGGFTGNLIAFLGG